MNTILNHGNLLSATEDAAGCTEAFEGPALVTFCLTYKKDNFVLLESKSSHVSCFFS